MERRIDTRQSYSSEQSHKPFQKTFIPTPKIFGVEPNLGRRGFTENRSGTEQGRGSSFHGNRARSENVLSRESRPSRPQRTAERVERMDEPRKEYNEPPRGREPVSLNALRPPQKKDGASSQNVDELRKTLKEALKNDNQESAIKNQATKENEKITETTAQNTNVPFGLAQDKKNNPPEIPEDELKKILDINSDKKN